MSPPAATSRIRPPAEPDEAFRIFNSAQDHLISESLYVSDPSGNGIEICFDTPERLLRREVSPSGRVSLIAVDGSAHSGLEPLNMSGLLRDLGNSGHVEPRMAQDAFIGHIHLRARAPEMLMKFYLGVLGFRPHIQSRSFGMFDCGTTWRGFSRCSRCHWSVYLPPTRARSGPVRLEPHWNGRS